MKKTLITLMATLAVIAATLCMAFTMTACEKKADSYKISVVYADGTPVNGLTDGIGGVSEDGSTHGTKIQVQICAVDPELAKTVGIDAATGHCNPTVDLDANGKVEVKYNESDRKENEKWHVKLLGVKDGYTYEEIYLDGYGEYTIKLTAQN